MGALPVRPLLAVPQGAQPAWAALRSALGQLLHEQGQDAAARRLSPR